MYIEEPDGVEMFEQYVIPPQEPNRFEDPTFVEAPPSIFVTERDTEATLEELLKRQLAITSALQSMISDNSAQFSPREFKELAATANSLVTGASRAGEALRALATYRAFIDVVVEFIKRRSDSLGDDLVAELLEVSREMRSEHLVSPLLKV